MHFIVNRQTVHQPSRLATFQALGFVVADTPKEAAEKVGREILFKDDKIGHYGLSGDDGTRMQAVNELSCAPDLERAHSRVQEQVVTNSPGEATVAQA